MHNPDQDIQRWVSGDLPKSPYPGLRPFDLDEWQIFFGREEITNELIDRLITQHVVSVHGSSGSGKSSLVRAGVMPRLEQDHATSGLCWRNCTMVPGNAPLENLAKAIAEIAPDSSKSTDRVLEIRRVLNRGRGAATELCRTFELNARNNLCILIDQFEELFRFANTNRAEALLFVEILVGLAEKPPEGLYAILTMRSDYLGDCARFPDLAKTVNQTQYLLPRMNRADLLRAVREPAELYGGWVNADLADQLVSDANAEQDELPLIQHGLMVLWRDGPAIEEGSEGRELRLADYVARTGLGPILSDHADSIVAKAAPDEARRKIVERLFRALTDTNADRNGIRRPQPFSVLCAVTGASDKSLKEIIDHFRVEGVSFLRPYYPDGIEKNTEIDISHEALIRCWNKVADRKDGWLQHEFRDGLIWRALLVAADGYEADATNVLGPTTTDERDRWLASRNDAWARRYGNEWERVQRLMKASREARDRLRRAQEAERRRTRIFAVAAVIFAIGMGFYAYASSREKDRINNELAGTLWTQLEFKEPNLLPTEISALWDLTTAEESVHRFFWQKLIGDQPAEAVADRNERIRKLGIRPEHLTRTTGLESARSTHAVDALLGLLSGNEDIRQIAVLTRALRSLPTDLTSEQVAIVLKANLFGLRNATESDHLRVFAGNFGSLARRLSSEQIDAVYKDTVEVLRRSLVSDQLTACARILVALAPQLSPENVNSATQIAFDNIMSGIQHNATARLALIGALEELLPALSSRQIASIPDALIAALNGVERSSLESALVRGQQLWNRPAANMPADIRKSASLKLALYGLLGSTDPNQLKAFVGVLGPLLPQLEPSQFDSALADMLPILGGSIDPDQLHAVVDSLKDAVGVLSPEQVELVRDTVVGIVQEHTDTDQLEASTRLMILLEPKLSTIQVENTVRSVLESFGKNKDIDQLSAYQEILAKLAPRVAPELFNEIVRSVFQMLGSEKGQGRSVALVKTLRTLEIDSTPDQREILLAALLQGLRDSVDPDELRTFVSAFLDQVPKLSEKQIGAAFDVVIEGLRTSTDYDQLPAIVQVLEGILSRLSPGQLDILRERVTRDIDPARTANLFQLRELINVASLLKIKLAEDQTRGLLDFVLRNVRSQLSATTSSSQPSAPLRLLSSLSRHLTEEQVDQTFRNLTADFMRTRTPTTIQSRALSETMRALAPSLTPEHVDSVVDRIATGSAPTEALAFTAALPPELARTAAEIISQSLRASMSQARLSALVQSLSAIARVKTVPYRLDVIVKNTYGRIDQTPNPNLLSALVRAFDAFVPRLTPEQIEQILNSTIVIKRENRDQITAHINVLGVIAPRLTLDQVPFAFEYVLKASRPDIPQEQSKAIYGAVGLLLDSVKDRAREARPEETRAALATLLKVLGGFDIERSRTNPEQGRLVIGALERLVEIATAFAPKADPKHMHETFGAFLKILSGSGYSAGSTSFVQSLEAAMPHLAKEHGASLSRISRTRLALAVDPDEGAAWARLIDAELSRLPERDHLREVIKVLKYPTTVGQPSALLLSGVRRRFGGQVQGEAHLAELISLVRSRFPDVQQELMSAPENPSGRGSKRTH